MTRKECKHAIYVPANDGSENDLLFVKELIHLPDGTKRIHCVHHENLERPFWVTRKALRVHKDKKEWTERRNLDRFKSTQIKLPKAIQRALGQTPKKTSLRRVARSPYVYGVDVTTPVLIKHAYSKKWPKLFTPNTVAVFDLETDMVNGTEYPIMGAITMRDRACLVITKEYASRMRDYDREIRQAFKDLLPEVLEARKIQLEIIVAENDGELCWRIIQKAHEYQPDFLTGWNLRYDMDAIVASANRHGYDLARMFSDPSVPPRYQTFRYTNGPQVKVTASGKETPIPPVNQWLQVEVPASFQIVDSMQAYCQLRVAKGKEPSYALDRILAKEINQRKLKYEAGEGILDGTIEWHAAMQSSHPAAYAIYNLWDCIGIEVLDEKTKDLTQTVPILLNWSELKRMPSQPRRICDDQHFFVQETRDCIIGSTSDQMNDELSELVVPLEGWIVTLPSYLAPESDIRTVEDPSCPTRVFTAVADIDSVSSYPSCTTAANLSKETTVRELIRIDGMDFDAMLATTVDITGGFVNASSIAKRVHRLPDFNTLLADFQSDQMKTY